MTSSPDMHGSDHLVIDPIPGLLTTSSLSDELLLNGLIGESAPLGAPSSNLAIANGTLYTATLVAHGALTTDLLFRVAVVGNLGSTGVGGAKIYLWNATGGVAIASLTTSAVDTALETSAVAILPWSAPAAVTPGSIYIAGLWLPTSWALGTSNALPQLAFLNLQAVVVNTNCASPTMRQGATASGTPSTTLPGTITSGNAPWFGIK